MGPLKKPGCWKEKETAERKKITKVRMESADGPHSVTNFEWKAAYGYS